MSLPEPDRVHVVAGHHLDLSVLELGPQDAPCVVMLHGLRDSAYSLLPVAQIISQSGSGDAVELINTDQGLVAVWLDESSGLSQVYGLRFNGTTWESLGGIAAADGGISGCVYDQWACLLFNIKNR